MNTSMQQPKKEEEKNKAQVRTVKLKNRLYVTAETRMFMAELKEKGMIKEFTHLYKLAFSYALIKDLPNQEYKLETQEMAITNIFDGDERIRTIIQALKGDEIDAYEEVERLINLGMIEIRKMFPETDSFNFTEILKKLEE